MSGTWLQRDRAFCEGQWLPTPDVIIWFVYQSHKTTKIDKHYSVDN